MCRLGLHNVRLAADGRPRRNKGGSPDQTRLAADERKRRNGRIDAPDTTKVEKKNGYGGQDREQHVAMRRGGGVVERELKKGAAVKSFCFFCDLFFSF